MAFCQVSKQMPKIKRITIVVEAKTSKQLEGKIIRLLRISKGISQMLLADKLGVSRATIQNWERTGTPNEACKIAIASVLGIDVEELG